MGRPKGYPKRYHAGRLEVNLPYGLLMQTEPTEISNRNRQIHILSRFCCQIGRLPATGFDDSRR